MKKIKIKFKTDAEPNYWEEEVTQENETPRQCAERIVNYFNNTLKPGEEPRKLLEVEVASDSKILIPHKWRKTNIFTNIKGRGITYDTMECEVCGAKGKRYGLNSGVAIDYKFRGKRECINN